jgi:hypothetical protein
MRAIDSSGASFLDKVSDMLSAVICVRRFYLGSLLVFAERSLSSTVLLWRMVESFAEAPTARIAHIPWLTSPMRVNNAT